MIIKSFELDKLNLIKSNLHLIYGNNEGIKEDIINKYYLNNFEFLHSEFFKRKQT